MPATKPADHPLIDITLMVLAVVAMLGLMLASGWLATALIRDFQV